MTMDRKESLDGDGLCEGGTIPDVLRSFMLLLLACPRMGEVGEGFCADTDAGDDR